MRVFTKFFLLLILSTGSGNAQNCAEETTQRLQGTWLRVGFGDTALLLVKNTTIEFNFKGAKNWNPPYTVSITSSPSFLPDSVLECSFLKLMNAADTLQYRISWLTDSTMQLTKYTLATFVFFDDGNPGKYIERQTVKYKKVRGLAPGYTLKAPVIGRWCDETTTLVLKSDSTFTIVYSEGNSFYSTGGKYRYTGEAFVLKDTRCRLNSAQKSNFQHQTRVQHGHKKTGLKTKRLLFDANGEIHLYYNWLGLWIQENHRILTKMR